LRTERKIHKQRILLTLISLQVCLFAQPTVTAKSPPTNAQNVSASTSLPVASLNDLTVNPSTGMGIDGDVASDSFSLYDRTTNFTQRATISLTGVSSSSVAWGDYDNDDDLDILLTGGSYLGNKAIIYRNDGSDIFTEMTEISLLEMNSGGVDWGDYDNDGDLDIVMTWNYNSRIYRNNGSSFTYMSNIILTGVINSSVAWGDYDNNGNLDILLTGETDTGTKISQIYQISSSTNNIPSVPTNLSYSVSNSIVTLSWNKSTDTETTQDALTYNIYLGTSPGGVQIISPMANLSNGYRRVAALGNTNHNNSWVVKGLVENTTYYWSVQAVDNAFAGSAFATENSFEYGAPTVSTASISDISEASAKCGGNVTDGGGFSVPTKGVVWGTSENPTIESYSGKTNDGSGLGSYVSELTNLIQWTTYYVRAYATNSEGTGYGENKSFVPVIVPGNALDFPGGDDIVDCGNDASLDITSAYTLEAWVANFGGESFPRITDKYPAPSIYIAESTNQLGWYGYVGGVSRDFVFSNTSISIGVWTHVAVTYDGSAIKAYVNGILKDTRSYSGALSTTTNNLTLGNRPAGDRALLGKLDELRIWSDARTATEIQDNMFKVLNGDEANLVAYYTFDHESGTTLSDFAGDNDGTLTNMAGNEWVTSPIPVGVTGVFVNSTTQTAVGDAGKQLKTTITSGGDGTNFLGIYTTGSGTDTVASGETFPSGVTQRSDIFWGIEEYGSVTANLIIDYSQISGISTPSAIKLLKRDDVSSDWTNVTSSYTHDTNNRTFTATGVTSFSEFSVGDGGDNSLPVELSAFHAEANERSNSITIYWVTESEVENLGFILERRAVSAEQSDWIEIANYIIDSRLQGQGSVTYRTTYSYIDDTVEEGETYDYRLADVSYDGTVTYYEMFLTGVEIKQLPTVFKLYPNYPNPFNPITTINYDLPEDCNVNLIIYNITGRQVIKLVDEHQQAGYKSIRWNSRNNSGQIVGTGMYFYAIEAGKHTAIRKMVLMK